MKTSKSARFRMAGSTIATLVLMASSTLAAEDGALLKAVESQDHAALSKLVRTPANVNAANLAGLRPLHVAVAKKDLTATRTLLEAGADPNAVSWSGETPLMKAAWIGSVDQIRLLIGHGAKVDAREPSDQQTPLMWAVSKDHLGAARALLQAGANVNARAKPSGFTPILFAARTGNVEMAKLLLDAGAHVDDKVVKPAKAPQPQTPFGAPVKTATVEQGWPEVLSDPGLVRGPCNCAKSTENWTGLLIATHNGNVDFARLLLERGADPNAAAPGFTALHFAAGDWINQSSTAVGLNYKESRHWTALAGIADQNKKIELINALLDRGAKINEPMAAEPAVIGIAVRPDIGVTLWNATPFMVAAFSTNLEVMKILAARGASLDAALGEAPDQIREAQKASGAPEKRTYAGTTSLMLAAGLGRAIGETVATEESSLAAVKWLVERGADINARNRYGETAIFGAAHARLNSVVKYLAQSGARLDLKDVKGGTVLDAAEVIDQYGGAGRTDVRERNSTGDLIRSLLNQSSRPQKPS